MKKIFVLATICLFTLSISAQEKKCCAENKACTKDMTAKEIEACKAKCKAEGKVCDATSKTKKEAKSCCTKKA
ncbi:hypothetical protein [Flavobacterium sp. UMI-01]|uniref:hypothetical protein n=1 Tax=Flavobacterium sp. UMI-01 TaxID=1441053 RepID=UPI001C7E14B0|nr:hypothetical protein [Flavobacterium sp. UMI-01]GIZ10246.1 hypothetical protein FUMI01_29700 [Flavobacterium sp. UMI-01]